MKQYRLSKEGLRTAKMALAMGNNPSTSWQLTMQYMKVNYHILKAKKLH